MFLARPAHRTRWIVVAVCGLAITFDGYDLVVYGTTVPSMLAQWHIAAAEAGRIGSAALVGMLLGALVIGSITDLVGRRRTMIACITWFSVLTAAAAGAPTPGAFGVLRFLAGIGLGGLMPTTAALVVEYSPPGRRNATYAIMQSGYALGGMLAASLAIPLIPAAGWRVMYLIGAAPVILAVPLALRWLPESLEYLVLHGDRARAERDAARLGVPMPQVTRPPQRSWTDGLRDLAAPGYRAGTLLAWVASFSALLIVYGMNTWLPQIMRQAHFSLGSALSFLLVFNLGSIAGSPVGGRLADRVGSKPVVTASFLLAAASIALLATGPAAVLLYTLVLVAGYGTIGTQNLINAFVTSYYPPTARATGIGWSLGVGRLGAILGPTLGGLVIGSGAGYRWNFYLFAAVAVIGLLATAAIPLGTHRNPTRAAATRAPNTAPPTAAAPSA